MTNVNLRVAIVEDELSAAQELEQCLNQFEEGKDISFSITRFPDGSLFLRQYQTQYDVIFMDIRMPGTDGMTAAQKLREIDSVTPLVFVTNMVQYAVKGYEVDALDFIVKPISYTSFQMKMKRIMQAIEHKQEQGVLITVEGSTQVFRLSDLYFVEVDNHNLTYHTAQGNFRARGKLGAVERQLPSNSFFRCSSSHLVNLRYVHQVFSEELEIMGSLVRISRSKKKEFLAALATYLGKGG